MVRMESNNVNYVITSIYNNDAIRFYIVVWGTSPNDSMLPALVMAARLSTLVESKDD